MTFLPKAFVQSLELTARQNALNLQEIQEGVVVEEIAVCSVLWLRRVEKKSKHVRPVRIRSMDALRQHRKHGSTSAAWTIACRGWMPLWNGNNLRE